MDGRLSNSLNRTIRRLAVLGLMTGILSCGQDLRLVPVEGKVLYRGKPLEFGSVLFQPASGQPARGKIQPDGTFVLSTFDEGDGAMIGKNQVRITSFEAQRPGAPPPSGGELALGKSFIPRKYSSFGSSGLEVEVLPEGNEPFIFELDDE